MWNSIVLRYLSEVSLGCSQGRFQRSTVTSVISNKKLTCDQCPWKPSPCSPRRNGEVDASYANWRSVALTRYCDYVKSDFTATSKQTALHLKDTDQLLVHWMIGYRGGGGGAVNVQKLTSLLKSKHEGQSSYSNCFHTAYSLFLANTPSYNRPQSCPRPDRSANQTRLSGYGAPLASAHLRIVLRLNVTSG